LALDIDAEGIRGFFGGEMLALPITSVIGVVHDPGGLGFARRSNPFPFAD
jgi:hypothetical protein